MKTAAFQHKINIISSRIPRLFGLFGLSVGTAADYEELAMMRNLELNSTYVYPVQMIFLGLDFFSYFVWTKKSSMLLKRSS